MSKLYQVLGRVLPGLFVVLGILIMRGADELPYRLFENVGGSPGAFPFVLGAVMCAAAVAQLTIDTVKAIRARKTEVDPENQENEPAAGVVWTPWMVLGSSVIYTFLMPMLGFVIASVLWVAGLALILRPWRWLLFGIAVVVFIVIGYLVSNWYLPVRLPGGLLGR